MWSVVINNKEDSSGLEKYNLNEASVLRDRPSVIMQFGFQWFLNQENQKKPKKTKKTLKRGNLETHVHCSGNLPAGSRQVKPR